MFPIVLHMGEKTDLGHPEWPQHTSMDLKMSSKGLQLTSTVNFKRDLNQMLIQMMAEEEHPYTTNRSKCKVYDTYVSKWGAFL